MNDENCPPENGDANLSMPSVKAGAAVFGNLVFGTEYPEHSLCYSPSPFVSRNNEDAPRDPMDGKVLSFDKRAGSPLKPKKEELCTNEEAPKRETNRGVRQREPTKKKLVPHRKNPRGGDLPKKRAGYKQQDTTATYLEGDSANPAINGVRRSKEESLQKKLLSVSELREQRRREREELSEFNIEAEQTRREVIELRKKLNERFRQSKVERDRKLREERLAKVESEIQFKSQVHVDHKRTLKEQESARRRMSVEDRAKLRRNHQEGNERLKLASIQEDQALLEERHESSVAARNARSDRAEKRRDSFAFRNGDARKIREVFAEREAAQRHEEHASLELKWNGERDAADYKSQTAKERRDSLAFRNIEGKRIRDLEGQMKATDRHAEHGSYELKWAGERDAGDYKKQVDAERRDSLAFRNAEGKRTRDFEGQLKANENHIEHESFELKWTGDRDADCHRNQMDAERRDSFAFRNAEGKRIRDLEGQMKANENHTEHESYALKWAGDRDADGHRKQMDEERRDSFAFRNAEGKRIRDLEGQMKTNENHTEQESYELKWAGDHDADGHRKQMDEERRDGFAFRNAEGKRIRDLEGQMKTNENHTEHESYELKWAGDRDADGHRKQMREEKRDSFAFRNAEGKRIRDLEGQVKANENHNEHESYELKWAGERDADDYRKQMNEERRDSFAFRNTEGKRIRDLEGQMKATEDHNEHENYALKWEGERDADDYRKQMDAERRDGIVFRNCEGKRIRDLEGQMKSNENRNEHESFELKLTGERDADAYRKQMDEERRDSFAFRNAEGKRIRDLEGQTKTDIHHKEHESYELKWAGERDADDHKKRLDEERRDSFASRYAEDKRIRALESQMKTDAYHNEHESYETKWSGERDADEYKKRMDEERRNSFAFRNAEGKRVRDLEGQIKTNEHYNQHESYGIKWAGERDADGYRKQMDEERRNSFSLRNAEGRRIRDVESQMKSDAQQQEHESFELKWTGERDVDNYKKQVDEERRESLNFRNKEAARHNEVMGELRSLAQEKEHESYLLKWDGERDAKNTRCLARKKERDSLRLKGKEHFSNRMQAENEKEIKLQDDREKYELDTGAWQDVNDYVKECNRRKRLSLAFRAKEKRRHFQIEKEQAELKIHQQQIDTYHRSEDARHIEMAKLKERARIALECLNQPAMCSFGGNPFASLLG